MYILIISGDEQINLMFQGIVAEDVMHPPPPRGREYWQCELIQRPVDVRKLTQEEKQHIKAAIDRIKDEYSNIKWAIVVSCDAEYALKPLIEANYSIVYYACDTCRKFELEQYVEYLQFDNLRSDTILRELSEAVIRANQKLFNNMKKSRR